MPTTGSTSVAGRTLAAVSTPSSGDFTSPFNVGRRKDKALASEHNPQARSFCDDWISGGMLEVQTGAAATARSGEGSQGRSALAYPMFIARK